jgi:beta-lactamase class D
MKQLFIVAFTLISLAAQSQQITEKDFNAYFDQYGIKGSFLLYDIKNGSYIAHNLPRCKQGFLPASTFKIPNSLIGLETGVIPDSSFVIKWDGVKREIESWNKDHTLASAIRVSCLPYYQELARRAGIERIKEMLLNLNYGKMDVRADNVDKFWISGDSKITAFEQIDFLKRLYQNKLPVSQRSMNMVKNLIVLDQNPAYILRGKTGWSQANNYNIGWFVGWLERDGNAYIFALGAEATMPTPEGFSAGRRKITEAILKEMGLM